MEPWKQALIDFGILWSGSAFVTLFWIIWKGTPNTPLAMLGASVTNGAVGAGAGIGVIEKWGVRASMAIAAFVGAGIVERETIIKAVSGALRALAKRFGLHDDAP